MKTAEQTQGTSMQAFHGSQETKDRYLTRVRAHRVADRLIQGTGWENGKGCAVGCTLEKYDHKAYEEELGIPEWLARVEDTIFEGLSKADAMEWPERFLAAIKPGADLEKVKAPFLIFVLQSALEKFDHARFPDCKKAVDGVIALYERGETDLKKFDEAAWAARAAAWAARAAAEAAAEAAAWAARAARAAAEAAAWAAWAARAAEYKKFSDKLIQLLESA